MAATKVESLTNPRDSLPNTYTSVTAREVDFVTRFNDNWEALRTIPAGETISYQALAAKVGKPSAVRAVASACGANRLAIIVPCHRVIRQDGQLSGYRWGVARKAMLLQHEAKKET